MAKEHAYNGTMLKYLLEITASGFDMDRDDFEVTLKRGSKSLTFKKEDMVTEEYTDIVNNISITKHHYYVCFDSTYFGNGVLVAVVTAWIPDDDFDDGRRRIVDRFDLINVLAV
ncbi:MAG: hypothetical protein IJL91_05740 [Bacteroidales bacterium]|nr:hypothetical protein [Bacteroidales bacterium]